MVTGTVRELRLDNALAKRNSFQAILKVTIDAAAKPGLMIGNTIKRTLEKDWRHRPLRLPPVELALER